MRYCPFRRTLLACFAACLVGSVAWTVTADDEARQDVPVVAAPRPDRGIADAEATLAAHKVSLDREGLRRYFDSLQPSTEAARRVEGQIRLLGDPKYRVRTDASRRLLEEAATQPQLVNEALRRALESPDAEVRYRARGLLERTGKEGRELFDAALQVVAHKRVPGLGEEVLRAWPFCENEAQRRWLADALRATASPDDAALLTRAIHNPEETLGREPAEPVELQAAAVDALRSAAGRNCLETLLPLLDHQEDRLRIAAARAVIDFEPAAALETLLELLESDDSRVCQLAYLTLQQATGESFALNPFDPPAKRAAGIELWNAWYRENGQTAQLRLPLERVLPKQQRLLLALYNPSKILTITLEGKVLEESEIPRTPSGCALLPNGDRIVAEWSGSICQINVRGELVRRIELEGAPNGLDVTPDGNVLVPLHSGREVIAISPEGKILWRTDVGSNPTDVRHMLGGRMLVALHGSGSLVELDDQRRPVWSISGISGPESARPLPNGHILVAGASGVQEFDRKGNAVWKSAHPQAAYDAVYLDNGNVLIADKRSGLFEYTRGGDLVRKHDVGMVRRIHYY